LLPLGLKFSLWAVNKSATLAVNNESMRILASCFAILALGGRAVASDVQPNDHVMAIYDGIACSDWTSFEAFQNSDLKTLNKLPGGCLVVHGAPPTLFIADAVKESAAAVCIRREYSPPPCFWFSLGKVIARLRAGQRRI
jgi:hypothetical protein